MTAGNATGLTSALAAAAGRAVAAAARAAAPYVGRGDEMAADAAAVAALRAELQALPMDGRIVIGEGEVEDAAALGVGAQIGAGGGPALDVALDPLEGATLAAKMMPNALVVLALAPRGALLPAPNCYMDKIAIGPGYAPGLVDLDRSPIDNVTALAAAKGVSASDITVCVLDRPRHAEIVEQLRSVGARIVLIPDGDVAGVIYTTDPATRIDMYLGQGGAPEGVLAAAALKCVGGQFQGRLIARNEQERARAERAGITDLKRRYGLDDLVAGETIFAAAGVTHGILLDGVTRDRTHQRVHALVMNSATGEISDLRIKVPA